jgi:hypothetical protein
MLKKLTRWLGVCACLLFLCSGLTYAYDYPFTDPYVATVLSTPSEFADALPGKIPAFIVKIVRNGFMSIKMRSRMMKTQEINFPLA